MDEKVWKVWWAIAGNSRDEFYKAIESSPLQIDGDMMPDPNYWYSQTLLSHACQMCNLDAIAYLLSVPTTHSTYAECEDYLLQPLMMLGQFDPPIEKVLKALDLFVRCPPEQAQVPFKDTMVIIGSNLLCYNIQYDADIRVILKCMALGMYHVERIHVLKRFRPSVLWRVACVEARQAVLVILEHEHRTGRQLMPKDLWRVLLRMLST